MTVTMFSVILTLGAGTMGSAAPMGEEAFGNAPVSKHGEWVDGVLETANDKSRVYRRWINGNEDFCYLGDAAAMNRVITAFSKIANENKAVVLLPTRGLTHSFEKKPVVHHLRMNVPSGIYLGMARMEQDKPVMSLHPRLYIHIGGGLELGGLEIPKGLKVLTAADLVKQYQRGLTSTGRRTRGQACYLLGGFGWMDGVVARLARVLEGEDDWAQLNALSALRMIGPAAASARGSVASLAGRTTDERMKKSCQKTLDALARKADDNEAVPSTKDRDVIRLYMLKRRGK